MAIVVSQAVAEPLPLDFTAVGDPQLVEILEQSQNQHVLVDGKPVDRAAVAAEQQRLTGILMALGYRTAQVHEDPLRGVWTVETGALFRVGVVRVSGLRDSAIPEETLDLISETILGVPSKTADAGTLSDLERKVIRRLRDASYVLVGVKSRELLIDSLTATVVVRIEFEPGPSCVFGEVNIRGARRGESGLVIAHAPFKLGERFDTAKLLIYRKRLEQLGIFRNVRVEAGDAPGPQGQVSVLVSFAGVPPEAEVLDNAAKPGALASTAALLAIALALFAAPRTASRRLAIALYLVSTLILVVAAGLAVQRIMQLAGTTPF